jgi:hypothetical protein
MPILVEEELPSREESALAASETAWNDAELDYRAEAASHFGGPGNDLHLALAVHIEEGRAIRRLRQAEGWPPLAAGDDGGHQGSEALLSRRECMAPNQLIAPPWVAGLLTAEEVTLGTRERAWNHLEVRYRHSLQGEWGDGEIAADVNRAIAAHISVGSQLRQARLRMNGGIERTAASMAAHAVEIIQSAGIAGEFAPWAVEYATLEGQHGQRAPKGACYQDERCTKDYCPYGHPNRDRATGGERQGQGGGQQRQLGGGARRAGRVAAAMAAVSREHAWGGVQHEESDGDDGPPPACASSSDDEEINDGGCDGRAD